MIILGINTVDIFNSGFLLLIALEAFKYNHTFLRFNICEFSFGASQDSNTPPLNFKYLIYVNHYIHPTYMKSLHSLANTQDPISI